MAHLGNTIINGALRVIGGEYVDTINGVTVGSSPKFTDNDTKNTAGSTDTSSKIFLIGATSQAANPQTYSHDTAYVGTDGCLYSGGTKVLTAHQDISGKVNKSGDTMTNTLTIQRTGTHDNNYPASLNLWTVDSTNSVTSRGAISAYDGGEYGANMVITPNGNMFIGSGEAPLNHYNLYQHSTDEVLYMTSDNQVHIQSNGQTIANRLGLMIDNSGNVLPEKADVATNNSGSIGTSNYKWANGYFTNINGVAVGSSPKFTDTTYSAGSNITLTGTTFSLTKANVTGALGYTPPTTDTNTHRPIQVNGTEVLGNNTTALNLKAGSNVSITNSSGTVTIAATDTNTDTNVSQTNTTTDADYRVLFSSTADDTTRTEGSRKDTGLRYNPNKKTLKAYGGVYSHSCISGAGTSGYFNFLQLVVTGSYVNRPIVFSVVDRNSRETVGTILFYNNSGTDPALTVYYRGARPIYYIKTTTSTWDLYIAKGEGYGHACINILNPAQITNGGVTLTWKDVTVTALPTGYSTATKETLDMNINGNAATVNNLTVQTAVPANAKFTDTDTKNTAGSTDSSSKLFLIGATSQAANPQTYSHDTAYVGTDGCLYSGGTKVLTAHQDISGKLDKSGGTMTGQLKTSFNSSVAMGSYQPNSTTIANLCNELRYSSGCCGSFSLNTAYTLNNVTLATGWYNFLWIPHRSGGVNGAASGDNCNYGCMYITGMTVAGSYVLRYSSSAIVDLYNLHPDRVKYSSSVSAAVNATTCTITDGAITTSSMIEPFSSNSKGNVITITKMVVTAGQVVLTFPALSDATSFKVRITNT